MILHESGEELSQQEQKAWGSEGVFQDGWSASASEAEGGVLEGEGKR